MNKENAHLYLPLVQALADGKTIQVNYGKTWIDAASNADFKWLDSPDNYRIKPEPRTFEMWRNLETGDMFSSFNPSKEARNRYERITVQEVLND